MVKKTQNNKKSKHNDDGFAELIEEKFDGSDYGDDMMDTGILKAG
jgi:hypothetical protein